RGFGCERCGQSQTDEEHKAGEHGQCTFHGYLLRGPVGATAASAVYELSASVEARSSCPTVMTTGS
ncbi:MAG: hypothetical protein ACTH2X_14295, partial [Brachybacterium tyrofermentans]